MKGDTASLEVIRYIEENPNSDKCSSFYKFVEDYILGKESVLFDNKNFNTKYLHHMRNIRTYDENHVYEKNLEEFKNLWSKIGERNQLEILEIESYTNENYFLSKVKHNISNVKSMINQVIKAERPWVFYRLFSEYLEDKSIPIKTIEDLCTISTKYKNSINEWNTTNYKKTFDESCKIVELLTKELDKRKRVEGNKEIIEVQY